ncbi:MAG: NifB/NifX family molybdenum-iron cluster-binding protein [Pseudomonadota bacterium]|nr:NifB/NifX family molybdenum-iron cluster-binding protein [Pseudomonadota bacterium]
MHMNTLPSGSPARFSDLWAVSMDRPLPADSCRVLIAVASTDGARVNADFDQAEQFLLYEKVGEMMHYIGAQPCPRRAGAGARRHRTRLLSDCDVVICAQISDTSRRSLSRLGVMCDLSFVDAAIERAVSAL